MRLQKLLACTLLAFTAVACASGGPSAPSPQGNGATATAHDTNTAEPTTGQTAALEISSKSGNSFDKERLEATAAASVTVNYLNDTEIPHNIHFFKGTEPSAGSLAKTEVAPGPGNKQTATFTAPTAGEYLFHCDVHPTEMKGTLVVT